MSNLYYNSKTAHTQQEPKMDVFHTCSGRDHTASLTPARVDRLGCGCTRNRGTRCDGSGIEWLNPVACGRHEYEAEVWGA